MSRNLPDFEASNEVYHGFFSEQYPVRTTVQAGLCLRVKIEPAARRPA